MSDVIGIVENGARATLASSLYDGEVGVRQRGDQIELAWFGRAPAFRVAVDATLDDKPIRIVGLRSRDLVANGSGSTKAIVAIAEEAA